jgi:hypothetical protein
MPHGVQDLYRSYASLCELIANGSVAEDQLATELRGLINVLLMTTPAGDSESERERRTLAPLMAGFDWQDSVAWRALAARHGSDLSHQRLIELAKEIKQQVGDSATPLMRIHRRRKAVLVKWFQINWTVIRPLVEAPVTDPTVGDSPFEDEPFVI